MYKLFCILALLIATANPALAIRIATGSYSGNGTSQTIDISDTSNPTITDFQPNICFVKGSDTGENDMIWHIAAMGSNNGLGLSGSQPFSTTGSTITSFVSNGFSVSNSLYVNQSGTTFYYICFGDDGQNDIAVGSYTGNGVDNRNITISPAFQPEVCNIQRESEVADWKSAAHASEDTSFWWAAGTDTSNNIQALNSDGFQVGTSTHTNADTIVYYYFCIKENTSFVQTGSFTGNGTSQSITGVGFAPDIVLTKTTTAAQALYFKTVPMGGSNSCNVVNASQCTETTAITSLDGNGFSVGSHSGANESSQTIYWMAFKAAATTAANSFGPFRRRF